MDLSFNLKLEFNYVLVNWQNPSVRKAEKTVSLVQVGDSNWKHIYFTLFYFCDITYVTDISINLYVRMYIRQITNYKNSMNYTVANILLSSQDIKHILCNQRVHYRTYKGCPLMSILSQINPDNILQSNSSLILYFQLLLCISSRLFLTGLSHQQFLSIFFYP
jgi:hypothetical protein